MNGINGQKIFTILLGGPMQISAAEAYLEMTIKDDPGYVAALKRPIKTAEEIMRDWVDEKLVNGKDIVENNTFRLTDEERYKLEVMLNERHLGWLMSLMKPLEKDNLEFAFIAEEPKPVKYVPKKIGAVNTKAKGKFRQKPLGITRPYMY